MRSRAHPAGAVAPAGCGGCAWFADEPAHLEAVLTGLCSMGSAYASVRGDDGLCTLHGRLVSARATCPRFAARRQTVATEP